MNFLTRTVVRTEKLRDNSAYCHKVSPYPPARKDIWIENFVSKPISPFTEPLFRFGTQMLNFSMYRIMAFTFARCPTYPLPVSHALKNKF